jgi:hypothetical protein
MKENKNIDRLFQEKFKDFEAKPPEMAWQNIKNKLNKKEKKRRVIPFWLKASGIAASLLLGYFSFMNYNKIQSQIKTVQNENIKNKTKDSDINSKPGIDFIIKPNTSVITENEKIQKLQFEEINKTNEKSDINLQNKKLVNTTNKSNIVVTNNTKIKDLVDLGQNKKIKKQNVLSNTIQQTDLEKNIPSKSFNSENDEPKKLVNNTLDQIKNNSNRSVTIHEKPGSNKTQDSSIVAKISEEVYALEQLLKEKEVGKNAEEKEKGNKWGVSTMAAPVYFNSSTNGSPIDVQFADNSKSYLSTLSYGVGLTYNISKKMSIKAGVNSLALEYNTNDVAFTTSLKQAPQGQTMLSRNANGENIIFINNTSASKNSISGDLENFTQNTRGVLNQSTSYFEIPLEMSYKLIDKKFGLELIGGMSSLFLNNNSVSLLSNGMEMEIGQATNLNKVHFSSNIGIGFRYNFLKSLEANFNPMFKYQMNTYTDNFGNFRPYFIGLYSGLSYKF